MIELRYGIYDKINYEYLPQATRYYISSLLQYGNWVSVGEFCPSYEEFILQRYKQWFLKGIRAFLRRNITRPLIVFLGVIRKSLMNIQRVVSFWKT